MKSIKPLSKIDDIEKQFNDLFRTGDYQKKEIMQNPYNIKWVVEKFLEPAQSSYYLPILEECILEKKAFISTDIEINTLLKKDQIIIDRMKILINKGLDISKKSSMIVKKNSLPIFQAAIELGLDINTISKEGSTPLRIAMIIGASKIQNWLWEQPNIDKNFIDRDGRNYALLALQYKNLKISKDIFITNPDNFLEIFNKNANPFNKNKNIFHNLSESKSISNKKSYLYHQFLEELLIYIMNKNPSFLHEKDSTGKNAFDNEFINPLIKRTLNNKLSTDLKEKETSTRTLKI